MLGNYRTHTRMKSPYKHGIIPETGQYRGYGWFKIPAWDVTIAAPPKGGSSSLKQFMWMNEIECSYVAHNEVDNYNLFFVVRNPVSRFYCLWRSKCRDRENIRHKEIHGMLPMELLNYIKSGKKDVHWTPQVDLIGNLKPTLIPLECLTQWWLNNGYGELGVFNKTTAEISELDINPKRIIDFYSKDMELYTKAVFDYQCQLFRI